MGTVLRPRQASRRTPRRNPLRGHPRATILKQLIAGLTQGDPSFNNRRFTGLNDARFTIERWRRDDNRRRRRGALVALFREEYVAARRKSALEDDPDGPTSVKAPPATEETSQWRAD